MGIDERFFKRKLYRGREIISVYELGH